MKRAKRTKKKPISRLLLMLLFLFCLFTGYRYEGDVSWKNIMDLDQIGSILSHLGGQLFDPSSEVTENTFLVHFIDVGQGDSILLQSLQPGEPTENILIDAGESQASKTVIHYLEAQNVQTLDAVIATHPHSDHIGGLANVLENFEVKSVYMPKKVHNTKTFEKLVSTIQEKGLKAQVTHSGMKIPMNGVNIQVLAPVAGEDYESLNNYSIVLSVRTQGKSFLLTGDAEKLSEKEQLEQNFYLKSDVLKVGHHGSKTSSGAQYIEEVAPKYAVISCGKDNEYGLPAQATLETLQEAGCIILRTDESGSIVMKVKEGELSVLKEK